MSSEPKHSHRFKNRIVRYDKHDDKCFIKIVFEDFGATFRDVSHEVDLEELKDYATHIENTTYFKDMDNSRT